MIERPGQVARTGNAFHGNMLKPSARATNPVAATSGLMDDFPTMTLLRACRLTPRILAPSEIDRPNGSRHALRIVVVFHTTCITRHFRYIVSGTVSNIG